MTLSWDEVPENAASRVTWLRERLREVEQRGPRVAVNVPIKPVDPELARLLGVEGQAWTLGSA